MDDAGELLSAPFLAADALEGGGGGNSTGCDDNNNNNNNNNVRCREEGNRYDALGSTSANASLVSDLLGSIVGLTEHGGGKSPSPTARGGDGAAVVDEADSAAGGVGGGVSGNGSGAEYDPSDRLSGLELAVIVFFGAAGGPFGTEPAIKAAGNLYAIIGFSAMPFLWSLPEAYMTYELSALYPCASGGTRWTQEAFGESWGLFVGFIGWISGVTNNASYPVLFLSYVRSQFPHLDNQGDNNFFLHYGALVAITATLALVNYTGLEVVGKTNLLIFFVSMAPFVLMVVIGIPKVDPSKWLQIPDSADEAFDDDTLSQNGWFLNNAYPAGIALRPFVNNLYWNFNGFDQASHYSTSVTKKALRNGLGGSFLLVASVYLLPILISTGATDINQDDWKAGAFAVAATKIGGRWLGNWVVFSSGISLLAQFFSEMSADSMQIQGMADLRQVPQIFGQRSRFDTPTYAILLGSVVIMALLPLPFVFIIELSNFAFCMAATMEFLSFARLRIYQGDNTKLRKILYVIMIFPPLILNVLVVMLASYATYIYGALLVLSGVILVFGNRIRDGACCTH